jgi:hypothetical protein
VGRAQIQVALNAVLAQPTRSKIEDTPHHSAAISKDVIVVQGVIRVIPADTSRPPLDTFYTRVLIRQGDQWRIAAAQSAQPNPWSVSFPATAVGQTAPPKIVSLTNVGDKGLKVREMFLMGKAAADFGETNTCTGSIPPSGSCTVTFTFSPKGKGSRAAQLSFLDDAATGGHEVRLTGTGQ